MKDENTPNTPPKVGFLVIGDEILSGKTKEGNAFVLANGLLSVGYMLAEVRIVPDIEEEIIKALNALRAKYTLVFTSGGIGPTHDDITSEAVAKALGLSFEENFEAALDIRKSCEARGVPFNTARKKMAMMPKGSQLLRTPSSTAPGFWVQNVYVLAGVPHIFESMLQSALQNLKHGVQVFTEIIEDIGLPEGAIAEELGEIQKQYRGRVVIGSYPRFLPESEGRVGGSWKLQIVLKGMNLEDVLTCKRAVEESFLKVN